jgi:hypothetical protein
MRSPLVIGAALAILCFAYVLSPIVGAGRRRGPASPSPRSGRVSSQMSSAVTDEEIEAAIMAYRTAHPVGGDCAVCGPRPEADAVFCSNCGRPLGLRGDAGGDL